MCLVPHRNTWQKSTITRIAEEFMNEPVAIYQGIHGGRLPKSGSFLSVDKENIVVSTIKLSEKGNDPVIRCVETMGEPVTATLDLPFAGKKWTGTFRPCEIKTLRLMKDGIREVNLLEE